MSLFTSFPTPLVEEGGRKGNMALHKVLVNKFSKICKVGMSGNTHSAQSSWLYINGGRSCGVQSRVIYHPGQAAHKWHQPTSQILHTLSHKGLFLNHN